MTLNDPSSPHNESAPPVSLSRGRRLVLSIFIVGQVLAVFIEQLKVAKPHAYGSHYPEISSAIQDAIQAAVSGQAPVADALNRAQATITPLLP